VGGRIGEEEKRRSGERGGWERVKIVAGAGVEEGRGRGWWKGGRKNGGGEGRAGGWVGRGWKGRRRGGGGGWVREERIVGGGS